MSCMQRWNSTVVCTSIQSTSEGAKHMQVGTFFSDTGQIRSGICMFKSTFSHNVRCEIGLGPDCM